MGFKYLKNHPRKRKLNSKQLTSLFLKSIIIWGFGLIIYAVIDYPFSKDDLYIRSLLQNYPDSATAEIIDSWIEQEEDEDSYAIYGYEYRFSKQEIGEFTGISYSKDFYEISEEIKVYYVPDAPYYNRADKMRSHPEPFSLLIFYWVLIIGGIITIIIEIVRLIHKKMYLERGILVMGQQISIEEQSPKGNSDRSYSVTYEFTNSSGEKIRIVKSVSRKNYLPEWSQIVYLPEVPERAKLVMLLGTKYRFYLRLEE